MLFSWDPGKSEVNLRERRFDLALATQVFEEPTLERVDDRHDCGEERKVAIGQADGVLITVVYTDRTAPDGSRIRRIISARRSNRREREEYEKAIRTPESHPGSS